MKASVLIGGFKHMEALVGKAEKSSMMGCPLGMHTQSRMAVSRHIGGKQPFH